MKRETKALIALICCTIVATTISDVTVKYMTKKYLAATED